LEEHEVDEALSDLAGEVHDILGSVTRQSALAVRGENGFDTDGQRTNLPMHE
jgi:hypothetical protein